MVNIRCVYYTRVRGFSTFVAFAIFWQVLYSGFVAEARHARKKLKVEEKKMQDYLTKLLDEIDTDQILLNQEEGYDE